MEAQKIANRLLDHEDRLKLLEQDTVRNNTLNKIFELLDKQSVILERLDQEHVSMNQTLKRVQSNVEDLKIDASNLKSDMKLVKEKLAV